MDEAQDFIKKYWPYLLGGLIAIYLLMRSGSSSASSDSGMYSAYLAAQTQAANTNAQAQLQQSALHQQAQMRTAQLTAQTQAVQGQQQIHYLTAQGSVAQAVGGAAANLVRALYQPAITAMGSSAYENAATLNAASQVAVGGFATQAALADSASKSVDSVATGLQTFGQIQAPKSNMSNLFSTLGQLGNTALLANSGVGSMTFGNRGF